MSLGGVAVTAMLALAGCGAQDEPGAVIAKPVTPPALPTTVPAEPAALPEAGQAVVGPSVDEPPKTAASSTKRPATPAAPARSGLILSAADRRSFRKLALSLNGVEGLAVSGIGTGQRVEHAGSLRTAVAWSTGKVPVAMAVLASGDPQAQRANLTRAITASDNAAALGLWASLGSAATAAQAADVQLRSSGDDRTQIESRNLRGTEYTPFGQTAWALTDQARFTAGLLCTSPGQGVVDLMSQVVVGQRWGLGGAGVPAALKGGWGPGSQPGVAGEYLDRQMGLITLHGKQLAVAIATQPGDGAHETGTANLTTIARWLVSHADVSRLPTHC